MLAVIRHIQAVQLDRQPDKLFWCHRPCLEFPQNLSVCRRILWAVRVKFAGVLFVQLVGHVSVEILDLYVATQ